MSTSSRLLIVVALGFFATASAGAAARKDTRLGATPARPLLNFGEDRYTLSAWVRTTAGRGPIFTVGPLNGRWSTGCKCIYVGQDGRINLRAAGAGHSRGGPKINDGKWHHIVMPSFHSWRFYIDGKQAFMHILDGVPDPGSKRNPIRGGPGCVLKIGQGVDDFPNDTLRQFTGQIDDVRIYDRLLKEEEIKELFEGKTAFGSAKLLAHWSFENSVSDTAPGRHDQRPVGKVRYAPGIDRGSSAEFDGGGALWLPLTDRAVGKQGRIITARLPDVIEPTYETAKYGPALVKEMGFRQLLFVKRDTYHSSHFYSDFIDGCSRFGSNICILDLSSGKVKNVFSGKMTKGIFGRVDLSFDARKIVFGWKASEREGFRIYEANIDGSGLHQITFPPKDEALRLKKYDQSSYLRFAKIYHHQTDDMHPCYLPDGGIMFVSSRCEYGTLCNSDDQLATTVVYRVETDGSKLEKLTNSPVSEFTPSLQQDGRVVYTRWEYVDKGQIGVKCLWSMNPDGTASREVFGAHDTRFILPTDALYPSRGQETWTQRQVRAPLDMASTTSRNDRQTSNT